MGDAEERLQWLIMYAEERCIALTVHELVCDCLQVDCSQAVACCHFVSQECVSCFADLRAFMDEEIRECCVASSC